MLIVFEGPDSVGKSTISSQFADRLRKQQRAAVQHWSFPGREAGTLGHLVCRLHHVPSELGVNAITSASKQALHIAAHLDAIESRILPALAAGEVVVLDRFWWSTLVYGTVSGADASTLRAMIAVEECAWHSVRPTMAFLVDRAAPFVLRGDERLEEWHRLRASYSALAEREARVHPVFRIQNDENVAVAVDRAVGAVSQFTSTTGTVSR
jgi:thymidylate kinase